MIQYLQALVQQVSDKLEGRSPQWNRVRKTHLFNHPSCAACGGKDSLEVHHIEPFHIYPSKELDPTNLITLCSAKGRECHIRFGHGFNWKHYCPAVVLYAEQELHRLKERILNG